MLAADSKRQGKKDDVLILHPHALPVGEVVRFVASDTEQGLTSKEAARRLVQYGPNVFSPKPRRGPLLRFLLQFHHPLIYCRIFEKFFASARRQL